MSLMNILCDLPSLVTGTVIVSLASSSVCKICYGSASLSYIPKFIVMLGWIFPTYFQVCLVNALFWMISYNSLEKAHHLPWMEQNHIRILHRNALNGCIKFERFDIIIILSISVS